MDPLSGLTVRDLGTGETIHYEGGWIRNTALQPPSGGTTIDSEARAVIEAILAALGAKGIVPAS